MARKIKSTKIADVWYTKDNKGKEIWTVIKQDKVVTFDTELTALNCADPDVPNYKIVEIDDMIMLKPANPALGVDQPESE